MSRATVVVDAGEHRRVNCPVKVGVPPDLVGDAQLCLRPDAGPDIPCQLLRDGGATVLCFILPALGKGEAQRYVLVPASGSADSTVALCDQAQERKIDVTIGNTFFTSLHYGSEWARPFLLPVVGAYGASMTRRYPVDDVEGETKDHHHHKSVWVAWGDVNGTDNWSEQEGHARQVHQRFVQVESGPVFGRIVTENHWVSNAGEKVLEEERSYIFYNVPPAERLLDQTVKFHASEGPVTFGDTKEGGIASVRVASSMDAKADGTIVNSFGGTNEAETWGKRAHWCDYSGPVDGKTVGIAIFDTPSNFRYPTYWHVRNYGLMTANPFGLSHFMRDKAVDGSHTIEKGASFPFSYRLYFHAGDTATAGVADKFLDYVAPPSVEVL